MKSKTIAATMTTMSRLTMFDREVGQGVRHVLAAVDRLLEIVEDLFLAQEHARIDLLVAEQAADRLAIDDVGFLLELAQPPTRGGQLGIGVLAQARQCVL